MNYMYIVMWYVGILRYIEYLFYGFLCLVLVIFWVKGFFVGIFIINISRIFGFFYYMLVVFFNLNNYSYL